MTTEESVADWIKTWYIHAVDYYSTIKRNEIGSFVEIWIDLESVTGFPGSSPSKVSTCNAGDPGSIPGSERSPGEGRGYPLQFPW